MAMLRYIFFDKKNACQIVQRIVFVNTNFVCILFSRVFRVSVTDYLGVCEREEKGESKAFS